VIQQKKILAVIPARGGSKGLPGKNLKKIFGKSLLQITKDAASNSKYIDQIILSSDDQGILEEAKKIGLNAPFIRPAELATDSANGIDVIIHAIEKSAVGFDYVIMLQPTSPLRSSVDIDAAIELCLARGAESCVSVTPASKSPLWMFSINADGNMEPALGHWDISKNRQALPTYYALNGAVYISSIAAFLKHRSFIHRGTIAYSMPVERSVDVDTELDLILCEYYASRAQKGFK
jgi:CMP-N,N'-diacetyllegionaminic acid synthase